MNSFKKLLVAGVLWGSANAAVASALEATWAGPCKYAGSQTFYNVHVTFSEGHADFVYKFFDDAFCATKPVHEEQQAGYAYQEGGQYGMGTKLDLGGDYTIYQIVGNNLFFGPIVEEENQRPVFVNYLEAFSKVSN